MEDLFTEVLGMSLHRRWLLSTSDMRVFFSLFAGDHRILCWNSELALIHGWTEVQMCHGQWKPLIRRSVFSQLEKE